IVSTRCTSPIAPGSSAASARRVSATVRGSTRTRCVAWSPWICTPPARSSSSTTGYSTRRRRMALDSEEGRRALLGRLGKEPFGRLAAELGATEREVVDYLRSLGEE